MTTTVSTVLMSISNEPERVLLRSWCDECAKQGGSFSIETKHTDSWYVTYKINWFTQAEPPTPEEP